MYCINTLPRRRIVGLCLQSCNQPPQVFCLHPSSASASTILCYVTQYGSFQRKHGNTPGMPDSSTESHSTDDSRSAQRYAVQYFVQRYEVQYCFAQRYITQYDQQHKIQYNQRKQGKSRWCSISTTERATTTVPLTLYPSLPTLTLCVQ